MKDRISDLVLRIYIFLTLVLILLYMAGVIQINIV